MNILLVEDNEGDVELTRAAFEEGGLTSSLAVAHNGAEALEYLRGPGKPGSDRTPALILLDLNMPRMGGKEFLEAIKQDEQLKCIPVVILTSSKARQDIKECYERHANSYVIKPSSLAELIIMAKQVEGFWINLSQSPDCAA